MNDKYIKYSILVLLSTAFSLLACNDTEKEENLTPAMVYFVDSHINQSNVHDVNIYNTGEPHAEYSLAVYKSGVDKSAATVELVVLTDKELEEYNTKFSKNFEMMNASTYTLGANEVHFSGSYADISQIVKVDFDIEKLRAESSNTVLALKLADTSININEEKSLIIIKPKLHDVVISFKDGGEVLHYSYGEEGAEELVLDIEARIGIENNSWDTEVKLMVDPEYVKLYNDLNQTYYSLIDDSFFDLETTKTIDTGVNSTSYRLKIKGKEMKSGQFMLPIRLKESSKYKIDKQAVYCVKIDILSAKPLDRTSWSIIDFSTEEATGEDNGNNGRAHHTLDNDVATFWHSKWKGGKDPLPHYLVIDMQKEVTITQVGLQQRQNNNQDAKSGDLWLSNDNATWQKIGSFTLEKKNEVQVFFVTQATGRYLKVNITDSYHNDKVTSLSEIIPYGY